MNKKVTYSEAINLAFKYILRRKIYKHEKTNFPELRTHHECNWIPRYQKSSIFKSKTAVCYATFLPK